MSHQHTPLYQNTPNHHATPPYQNTRNERQPHQKPPYFSSNIPFWQSYLKTHAFPSNKKKSWQDQFQEFANHVDQSEEDLDRDNNEDFGRDTHDVRHVPSVEHDHDTGELNRNKTESMGQKYQRTEPTRTQKYTKTDRLNDVKQKSDVEPSSQRHRKTERIHNIIQNDTSKELCNVNKDLKNTNIELMSYHRIQTNAQMNLTTEINSPQTNHQSEEIDNRKVGRTNRIKDHEKAEIEVRYEKQINQIEPKEKDFKVMQIRDTFEVSTANLKANISQDTVESNRETWNEEKDYVNSGLDDIRGKFNANNSDKSQGNIEDTLRETKEKGVDRTEHAFVEGKDTDDNTGELNNSNLNKTEDILADVNDTDLKQSEEVDTSHFKRTEETNDNLIVEYNPRGSLLLQIQDSDESRRALPTPNIVLSSDIPSVSQDIISLSANTNFLDMTTDDIATDFKTPLPPNPKESATLDSNISRSHFLETNIEPLKSPKTNLSFNQSPKLLSQKVKKSKSAETSNILVDDEINENLKETETLSPIITPLKSPAASTNDYELSFSTPFKSAEFNLDSFDHDNESLLKPLKSPNFNLSSRSLNSRVSSSILSPEEDSSSGLSVHMSGQGGNGDDDW